MIRFSLERPVILAVGIIIVCLFGLAALFRVPIQLIPDLDPRVVTVRTIWPGASPQDVEKEILIEQEEFLRNVTGLERMISTASFGVGSIELEFPFGMDVNDALIRTSNALSQVPRYPENVNEPRISSESFSQNAFAFYAISPLPDNPKGLKITEELDWLEDNIKTRLERVPGIASVDVSGGTRRQLNVYLDPGRLASHDLNVMDVRRAIRARNRDISGGDMDFGKRRFLVRTLGRFEEVEDVNELIIAEREGSFIRLSDVGHAEMGQSELRSIRFGSGESQMFMSIRKQVGANIVEVFEAANAAIEELNAGAVGDFGAVITPRGNDVRYIRDSVRTVLKNLLIGAVLAVLVLRLFLRSWPATLIGAVGIPVCVLAAFLGLLLTGRTINVISMAGVAFAIGMTMDNSIVVLENIMRMVAGGKHRRDAALAGVREVWPAVLASTLTTVMVFLPVVFLELEAGQLYSDIAIAVSAMILMSMIVAVSLIPAISGYFLTHREIPEGHHAGPLGWIARAGIRVGHGLMGLMEWLLETGVRRASALALTAGITAFVLVALTPRAEYLPEGEEAKIFARMFAPPGYNLQTMEDIWTRLDPPVTSQIGADGSDYAAGKTDVPPVARHLAFVSPGFMLFITEPENRDDTQALLEALTRNFRSEPGMRSFASRGSIFSDNEGGSRSINVELAGRNLERLFETGLQVFITADGLFDGAQVNSDPPPPTLSMSQPIARVLPDWERAAELGISQDELGYILWAYSDGAFVDEFFLDDDKIDMYLYSTAGAINQPKDLEGIMIRARDGTVQLSSLARVEETVGTASIRRVNGLRTVTLGIIPPRNVPLETGVEVVREQLIGELRDTGVIPPDITATITGASTMLEKTREELGGNFILAIVIAYLLMVAVFSHWGFPLVIMTTVPIGISGGIVGLWILNAVGISQPFDVITMLGFLILIGTVVNNPILIVERAVRNIENKGMVIKEAVKEATHVRLRPVMMSTVTTICGLSPLVLLPGEGTELYRGLGAIVLFGLLFSSLVTLTILPVLLATVLEAVRRIKAGRGAAGAAGT
ncbi:MAG: efflux RND transporter permease subunit [Xanthomonadales bacterium]|nr:efflux RND transporter permease subunit [Xanthomonadales bacterium]